MTVVKQRCNSLSDSRSVNRGSGIGRVRRIGWLPPRLAALAAKQDQEQERQQRQLLRVQQHLKEVHKSRRGRWGMEDTPRKYPAAEYKLPVFQALLIIFGSVIFTQMLFRKVFEGSSSSSSDTTQQRKSFGSSENGYTYYLKSLWEYAEETQLERLEMALGTTAATTTSNKLIREMKLDLEPLTEAPTLDLRTTKKQQKCAKIEAIKRIPTVVIVSNIQSGAHTALDTIYNMFQGDVNVILASDIAAVNQEIDCECMRWLKENAKLVHARRNVLEVVLSVFEDKRNRDTAFRDSVSWREYLDSDQVEIVVDRWVKVARSWFLQDNVVDLDFSSLVRLEPAKIQALARSIGLSVRKSKKMWNRSNWRFVSYDKSGANEAIKQNDTNIISYSPSDVLLSSSDIRLSVTDAARITSLLRSNPLWEEETMLECESSSERNPFAPDQICVDKKGAKSVLENERNCKIYGPLVGRPTKGVLQSYVCIPNSCPTSLVPYMITRYKNKLYINKRGKKERGA